jgi:hypothetical protein
MSALYVSDDNRALRDIISVIYIVACGHTWYTQRNYGIPTKVHSEFLEFKENTTLLTVRSPLSQQTGKVIVGCPPLLAFDLGL